MKNRKQIREITMLAVLSALIILMSFTPIGYIRIVPMGLEITLLVIPVVIGAICLGPKGGLLLGSLFGITSLLQCVFGFSTFGATLFSINPFFTAILCIIPRALMGFLVGVIFNALNKVFKQDLFAHIIASVSGAILNTVFFMSTLCLFFYNTEYIMSFRDGLGSSNVISFIILFVGINGVVEAAVNFIIGAAVTKTLFTIFKKYN
ncbi:MAG: ECF transporter S component [Bacilli bacterium]|nr:ECF transporter S component [Bacilli bacterium]